MARLNNNRVRAIIDYYFSLLNIALKYTWHLVNPRGVADLVTGLGHVFGCMYVLCLFRRLDDVLW